MYKFEIKQDKPVDKTIWDKDMWYEDNAVTPHYTKEHPWWESSFGKVYKQMTPHLENKRKAIDVGACVGQWARQLSKDFQEVLCFEPRKIAIPKFLLNVDMTNVRLFNCGIGDKHQQVLMSKSRIGDFPLQNGKPVKDKYKETVDIVPIDEHNLTEIDLIKIDTDGYEQWVLPGMEQTIKTNKPLIVIEQFKWWDGGLPGFKYMEAVMTLRSWGYRCVGQHGFDWIMKYEKA